MSDDQVSVFVHPYVRGQHLACADVTVITTLGEVTIRGFRVLHQSGKAICVVPPGTSYLKNGETKYDELLDMSKATREWFMRAIITEFRRVTESGTELPVRPQRD